MGVRAVRCPGASLMEAQGRFRTRIALALGSALTFFPVIIVGTSLGSALGLAVAVAIYCTVIAIVDLATALWPAGNVAASIVRITLAPVVANLMALVPAIGLAYGLLPRCGLAPQLLWILQIVVVTGVMGMVYAALIRGIAPDLWRDTIGLLARISPAVARRCPASSA